MRPLAIIGIVFFASTAWAQPGREARPSSRPAADRERGARRQAQFGPLTSRLAEELKLTSAQREKYEAIVAKYRVEFETQRTAQESLRELSRELREARRAGEDTRAAELTAKMEAIRGERGALWDRFVQDVRGILDEQQAKSLDEWRSRVLQRGARGNGADVEASEKAGVTDVRRLFATARRLDLTDEQRAGLRQLAREMAPRGRGPDATPSDGGVKDVKAKIVSLLDTQQAAEFERLLKEKQGVPGGGSRGGADRPGRGKPGGARSGGERHRGV